MIEAIAVGAAKAAPALAASALRWLLRPEARKRLAKAVIEQVGGPLTKRTLRNWLKDPQVMELCASLDPALLPALAAQVEQLLERRSSRKLRKLSQEDRQHYAEKVSRALHLEILKALDAAHAVDASHRRLEQRFNELEAKLVAGSGLDDNLVRLVPAVVVTQLAALGEVQPQLSRTLLAHIAVDPEILEVRLAAALAEPEPDWIRGAPPQAWLAIARLADAHGHRVLARTGYRKARSEGGDGPEHLLTVLEALTFQSEDDVEPAVALLDGCASNSVRLVAGARATVLKSFEAVLALWSDPLQEEAHEEVCNLATMMVATAMVNTGRHASARKLLRRATERLTPRSWMFHVWAVAAALQSDAAVFGSHEHETLLNEANTAARTSIEMRRPWRGNDLEDTRLAVRIGLALGLPSGDIVALGREPPDGNASAVAAADSEVRMHVALAMIQSGNLAAASELLPDDQTDSFVGRLLRAVEAAGDDADDLFVAAAEAAQSVAERATALSGLAFRGSDLPGIEELRAEAPSVANLLEVDRAIALGDYESAVELAERYATSSLLHVERLASVRKAQGDVDLAIKLLIDGASSLHSVSMLCSGIDMLVETGRLFEAEEIALRSLASQPTDDSGDYQLRARLMDLYLTEGRWRELESAAAAACARHPERREPGWAIVHALTQQHRAYQAYEELTSRALEPWDANTAVLAIELRGRFAQTEVTADSILDLVDRYGENEAVWVAAMNALRRIGQAMELPDGVTARARSTFGAFHERFPNPEYLDPIAAGSMDELVAGLRDRLRPIAESLEKIASEVRWGRLPLETFARVSGHPLSAVCLGGGPEGFMVAIPPQQWLQEHEVALAREHLDGDLVFETSALATMVRAQNYWLANRAGKSFVADCVTADVRREVERCTDLSESRIAWDLETDLPRITDVDAATLEGIRERASDLLRLVDNCEEVVRRGMDWPASLSPVPDELRDEIWASSLAVASNLGVPLVSDDIVVRIFAREAGILTFGTFAVVEALHETGHTTELQHQSAIDALARCGLVDLPLDRDQIVRLIAGDRMAPGTAAFILSRPAAWKDVQTTLATYRDVVEYIASMPGGPDRDRRIATWAAATATGLGLALPPARRVDGLTVIATTTIAAAGLFDAPINEILEGLRSVLKRLGLDPSVDDPLRPVAIQVASTFARIVPANWVIPLMVRFLDGLSAEDRSRAIRAVLRAPRDT